MTSLILTDDFAQEALDAGRKLLASGETILELSESKGCFVARKGEQVPDGSTTIREFEVDGTTVILFTVI